MNMKLFKRNIFKNWNHIRDPYKNIILIFNRVIFIFSVCYKIQNKKIITINYISTKRSTINATPTSQCTKASNIDR